ncbi:hypothetical protein [Tumebacillus lipolyticus]|uniref:Uncharacterized protein n=1 Tax=Tumebacillus lipolyticus TaxID=1280370 RepID=A0ABW4ZVI6_9BACL
MSNPQIELVGVYEVETTVDVVLVEVIADARFSDIQMEQFTQKDETQPRMNWQTAYDEQVLDRTGHEVIGDFFTKPSEDSSPSRIVFFFHELDWNKLLITPFGALTLPESPSEMPARLRGIIVYHPVD